MPKGADTALLLPTFLSFKVPEADASVRPTVSAASMPVMSDSATPPNPMLVFWL